MIIKIKNLRLKTILGIHPWESEFEREIMINAEIETNFEQAFISDDIEDTLDYDYIFNKITNLVKNNKFKLIEKLAKEIMNSIMEDKRITGCKLEVDKLKVFDNVDSFSITLEQKNGSRN